MVQFYFHINHPCNDNHIIGQFFLTYVYFNLIVRRTFLLLFNIQHTFFVPLPCWVLFIYYSVRVWVHHNQLQASNILVVAVEANQTTC